MGFTLEEIRVLEKPFEALGNADALAQNIDELNKLSDAEKNDLATRLVLECPDKEFGPFAHAIEACRVPENDENSFHQVLSNAYEIKKRILSLLDTENPHPHTYLLGEEFQEDLYNNFNKLASSVLGGKEVAAAQRLALTTPEKERSNLARNIANIFPKSSFIKELQAAFALRREIDALLGDSPEEFFQSCEFNIDNCLKFRELFILLKDHENAIGEKLALLDDSTERSKIARQLEQINHAAHDQSNPFRLISAAMNPQAQQTHVPLKSSQVNADDNTEDAFETDSTSDNASASSAASHPNGLFASTLVRRTLIKEGPAAAAADDEESDDDEQKDQTRGRCCRLW